MWTRNVEIAVLFTTSTAEGYVKYAFGQEAPVFFFFSLHTQYILNFNGDRGSHYIAILPISTNSKLLYKVIHKYGRMEYAYIHPDPYISKRLRSWGGGG